MAKITIKEREGECQRMAVMIREVFDYDGPVLSFAEVEGSPDPSDTWTVKAQVYREAAIVLRVGPPVVKRVILALITRRVQDPLIAQNHMTRSELREALLIDQDPMVLPMWLTRAWNLLNANQVGDHLAERLAEVALQEKNARDAEAQAQRGWPWAPGEMVKYTHPTYGSYLFEASTFRDHRVLQMTIRENMLIRQVFCLILGDLGWGWKFTDFAPLHGKNVDTLKGVRHFVLWGDAAYDMVTQAVLDPRFEFIGNLHW